MYYLSRNNIVTGPYSKEALIQHGILSTDLIKKEGGTEWSAPSKFDEFKNAVSSAKPKFKITADKEVIELKSEIPIKNEALKEVPANSPFKRMPSAVPKKKTSTDIADNSDKTEQKKELPKSTVKPTVANVEPAPKPEKAEYKRTVKTPLIKPQRKENSTNVMKEVFAPLLILGGIGLAAWFGYKEFFGKDSSGNEPAVNAVPADSTVKTISADTAMQKKTDIPKKHVVDSSLYYARRDSVRRAEKARKDSLALIASAARKDSAKAATKIVPESSTVKKDIPTVTETKKPATQPVAINTPKPAEKKPVEKKSQSIGDYVSVSVNKIPDKEVKGIKLNVKNISDQNLNIAIIDVSYTDADGKIIRGETLQAENIGAGKTASIKVPNEKNAANITYKVSLISGDNVYLMGK